MKLQIERYESKKLPHATLEWQAYLNDSSYLDNLRQRVEATNSEGRFYVKVARHLLEILQGKIDPLSVLFQGDLVKDYYLEINARLSGQFGKLMSLLSHKNPALKVLEVGAGTGSTTAHIMGPLFTHGIGEKGRPQCSQFDFTDISLGFFERAQEDFKEYSSRMKFKVLDIEQDVLQQGFDVGTYDVIVAANVLHATKHLDITLKHVHDLLKPGGRLVLLEQTGDFARGGFAFGLLPGWLLSADGYRSWGPTMAPQQWDKVLKLNGFSGTDHVMNDYRDSRCQELSTMVSTVLEPALPTLSLPKTSIVVAQGSPVQQEIAQKLRDVILSNSTSSCDIVPLEEATAIQDISEQICVFLAEHSTPILQGLDQTSFSHLQSVFTSVRGIIWVTRGGGSPTESPEYQVVDGLLRTLRTENAMLKAITLGLDHSQPNTEATAKLIFKVLENTAAKDVNDFETEYVEMAGVPHTNRVIEANYMNQSIHKAT